ncbi:MAG: MFS transporter [Actinomycetes bacterium]
MASLTKWLRIDVSLLRTNRPFRNLWLSSLITRFGAMFTYVAAPFQIKELTGSYVAVGLLGVIEIIPLIVFGLYGGSIADRYDRRRVVLLCEVAFLVLSSALVANSLLAHPTVWCIYIVAMLMACVDGLQRPSLTALTPRVVAREDLATASALESWTGSAGFLIGTSLGGVIVVAFGFGWAYSIDVITYVISGIFLLALPHVPPTQTFDVPHLKSIVEGASYAWSRKDLLGTYLVDTLAMVFAFPNALFPFLADYFDSPHALGLFYSASAVGALLATTTSAWVKRVERHGLAVIYSAAVWGLAIALVGMTHSLYVAFLGLILAGAADTVSAIFRSTIWNTTIPDELRGRLAGIELLSYSIGPQLGQMRASISADLFGLRRAFISGGVLCTLSVLAVGRALPTMRKYRAVEESTSAKA